MKPKTTKSTFFNLKKVFAIAMLIGFGYEANAQLCNASFTYTNSNGIVTFVNTSTGSGGIGTTHWDFGDNQQSLLFNPTHVYTSNGAFTVCLIISDSSGTCRDTSCISIAVNYSVTNVNVILCQGDTFMLANSNIAYTSGIYTDSLLDISGGDSIVNYVVTVVPLIGASQTVTISSGSSYTLPGGSVVSTSGTYTDTLVSISGCDSVVITNLVVTLPCTASFTYTDNNGIVSFTNTSTGSGGIGSTHWDFGDNQQSLLSDPIHAFTSNGTFTVCLIISDSSGTCSDTSCVAITINSTATNVNVILCQGDTFMLANSNIVLTAGIYTDSLLNISGGDSIVNYFVTVVPLIGTSQTVTIPSGSSYTLPGGNVVSTSGVYTDTLISINGCDSVVITNLVVGSVLPCNASFNIVIDSVNATTYSIFNNSTGAGVLTYFWNFGDGNTSTLQLPAHSYSGAGPYWICLTITDSLNNCTDTYCDSIGTGTGGPISFTARSSATGMDKFELIGSLINYPNPFNGNTTIAYSIKQDATVELSVIDLLGNLVAIVDKGSKSNGVHTINWNAENAAKGMYLLQLKVSGQVSTKKMIVK